MVPNDDNFEEDNHKDSILPSFPRSHGDDPEQAQAIALYYDTQVAHNRWESYEKEHR